jgi:hypothetical protein
VHALGAALAEHARPQLCLTYCDDWAALSLTRAHF